MKENKYLWINAFLLFLLVLGSGLSLFIGKANVDLLALFDFDNAPEAAKIVLFEIRMPRAIMALLSGGGLAICGAVLQTYLRNPLADSGVLGISAFASLGAIIAIYFELSALGFWIVPTFGIFMAVLSLALLLLIVGNGGTIMFILSGIVLSAIAGGLIALFLSIAPNPYALSEMIDWQIGGFSDISNREVLFGAPLILIGAIILFNLTRPLSAFSLGDETAQSLGVDIQKIRTQILIGVGIIVGAISSLCGIISFVGLIIPHLLRPIFNNNPRYLLLPCFLFGGSFTIFADILVRLLWINGEIKLGVIMTLLGAPFFLHLLLSLRAKVAR